MAKGWTVWSETDARAEIALWKKSGQSLLKFTKGRGYTEARLRWWRKQLGDVPPAAPTALVPVRIMGAECAAALEMQLETAIEVVLRGGHVVRARRGFDAETLTAVVRALEGSC
jgi:hypothetical protein